MAIRTTCTCDVCHFSVVSGDNKGGVLADAKRMGWAIGTNRHVCPDCKDAVEALLVSVNR